MKKKTICLIMLGLFLFSTFSITLADESKDVTEKPEVMKEKESDEMKISPEKKKLIGELLKIIGSKKIMENAFNLYVDQFGGTFKQFICNGLKNDPNLSEEENRKIKMEIAGRIWKRYMELIPKKIDFGELIKEIYYPLYDKYFTEKEIRDLINFYKSPTGRKAIKLSPQIKGEAMKNTIRIVTPKLKEIAEEVVQEEMEREMKKSEKKDADKKGEEKKDK